MQLRCYRCSWSFAINQEELAYALETVEQSGGKHYDARCPRCRTTNKIPLQQLRRAAPRRPPETGATEAEPPTPTSGE
jgi:phage FluMu protein Com